MFNVMVSPTCRFSLLLICPILMSTGDFLSMTIFGEIVDSCEKRNDRIWGQSIIHLGTRHQTGYIVDFTTVKLLPSGQYQKILKNLGPFGPLSNICFGIGHFFLVLTD